MYRNLFDTFKGKMIGIDNRFKFFVIIKQGKSRLLKFVSVMNCLETNRAKIFTYLLRHVKYHYQTGIFKYEQSESLSVNF